MTDRRLALLAAPLAALAGFLVYANTLGHGFVWDDAANVLLDTGIRDLRHLPALFTQSTYAGAADAMAGIGAARYYRPLGMVSLALDHALWGERAFGYHLTNVLLHAAACALVARMLLARIGNPTAALAGALLFALHPVHVEAVAWVSGRNDLLLVVFALLADHAWRRFRAGGGALAALGALAACVGALFSKESAIVVPLLLALEEARAGAGRWLARLRGPALLALVAVAFLLARFAWMPPPAEPVPLATRLLTAPSLLVRALRLLFVPAGLRTFHWIHVVNSAVAPGFLVPLAVVLAAAVLTMWTYRRDRDLAFGLAWILVTLLPLAGIAGWPRPTPFAERYLVLPSVGWAIVVAALARRAEALPALAPNGRRTVAIAALAIAVALAAETWTQNPVWRDNLSLLGRMTRDAPQWTAGHEALGREYARAARWREAAAAFGDAARLEPANAGYAFNLGDALLEQGRLDEAAKSFARSLDLGSADPRAALALGRILERRDHPDDAARAYEHAIAMDPRFAPAYGALGLVRFEQNRWAEADSAYRRAIDLAPGDAALHQNLGGLRLDQGRHAEAIAELEEALRLDPNLPEAHLNLALERLTQGRAADAEREARAGLALEPSPRARLLLVQVLVAEGRRGEAQSEVDALLRGNANPELRKAAAEALAGSRGR